MTRSRPRLPKRLRTWVKHRAGAATLYSILGFLHLMAWVRFPVTFLLLSEYRIGGFAGRTEFYLRQRRIPNSPYRRGIWLAIIGKPANEYLLTLYKRYLHIFRSRIWVRLLNHDMTPGSGFTNHLKASRFLHRPLLPTMDDHEVALGPPVLSFTEAEELAGKELLDLMGIPEGKWFVCFQARDPAYYHTVAPRFDNSQTDHRDCSIKNYIDAMKYVASRGGYALRVGAVVEESMPNLGNPHIIDYASGYRSDFGDIYLLAKCKFFVGCDSGLITVPMMFNVPVIQANSLMMPTRGGNEAVYAAPLNSRDLFLPKPIISKADFRQLTLREVLQTEVRYFAHLSQYEEAGLQVLENSAEDILGATKEMNERLDGGFTYSDEDEALQSRFRSYMDPKPKSFDTFARVGADFLRTYRDLLE